MKRVQHIIPILLLVALLHSCYPASLKRDFASKSPYPSLKNQIDSIIVAELYPFTNASIKIVSLKDGSPVYESNSDMLMTPASLQKLFTGAAALSRLGSEHVLETSVYLVPGRNEIYVRGCGDPLLASGDIELLARVIAGNLEPGTPYRISGDTGCFDDKYWGNGWVWDDDPENESVYLSALSVNGNSVIVNIAPGKAPSDPLSVSVSPETRYVAVENKGITGKPREPCAVSIARPPGDRRNIIFIGGTPAPDCPATRKKLPVWRPELYFLTLLSEQLNKAGIITGSINLGSVPPDAVPLVSVKRPVGEIVHFMLKKSDNLCAENLLKYLGRRNTGKEGSASDGARVVIDYLQANGIATGRMLIADGSGMSRYNLNNADSIVQLLAAVYRDKTIYPAFMDALPLAGRDGTLGKRMKGTKAEGKVHAKTGSLRGISTLAGYSETADGEPVAFAILIENFTGPPGRVREVQDRVAVLLSTFSLKKH